MPDWPRGRARSPRRRTRRTRALRSSKAWRRRTSSPTLHWSATRTGTSTHFVRDARFTRSRIRAWWRSPATTRPSRSTETGRRTRRAIPWAVRIRPCRSSPGEVTDVTDVIEARRDQWPMSEFMVTMDGDDHETQRGLLRRLLTPRRLKENEAALAGIADRCIDMFIANGRCEVVGEYGKPFTTLAIADLLGVPEEDRDEVPQRPRRQQHRGRRRGSDTGRQSAGVHVRQVRRRTSRTAAVNPGATC